MGVNGIDNDPHAHPYARADKLGADVHVERECGGEGNLCLKQGRRPQGLRLGLHRRRRLPERLPLRPGGQRRRHSGRACVAR